MIGFAGKKRSGKDTCADLLVRKHGFTKTSFAEPLKEACRALFLFNDSQLYGDLKEESDPRWGASPREILQYVGTDLLRKQTLMPELGEDIFIRNLLLRAESTKLVVADVRFANEAQAIQKAGGIVIRIERPGVEDGDTHESEKLDFQTDRTIYNDGSLEDLYAKVEEILNSL